MTRLRVLPAPCALGTEGPRPVCLRRHRNVLPNSCAMCCEISGAHGSHCPLCPSPYLSVLFRTHPYRHCSQYRLCAMHTANRRECALFSGERIFPPLAADGIPNGIRTRVAGMRTRCPRPLDDGNTSMIRCLYYTPHPGKSKFTFLLFRSFYT